MWLVANGGTEPERVYCPRDGLHYTYMWNCATREHAWYCHETDLFVTECPYGNA